MRNIFSKFNKPFTFLWILFILVGGLLVLFTDKGDIVLWLNARHHPTLDIVFKYATDLGDGFVFLILVVGMLFYRYSYAIQAVFCGLYTLLLAQGLKKTLFAGWPRPTRYFDETVVFNFVEGVRIHGTNTFPSGHTIAGFSIFFFIAYASKNKYISALSFILALTVGFSRVYLLQHFFVDIYFGAILGE